MELMLACFLAVSEFFIPSPLEYSVFFWSNNLVCAFLIALSALLSYRKNLQKIHLITFFIAIYLILIAYLDYPEKFLLQHQSYVVLGLLFAMLSLVPSHSQVPPKSWIEFNKKNS